MWYQTSRKEITPLVNDKRKDSMKRKMKRGPDPSIKGLKGYECWGNEKLAKRAKAQCPYVKENDKTPSEMVRPCDENENEYIPIHTP
jgi:hypothetical protein